MTTKNYVTCPECKSTIENTRMCYTKGHPMTLHDEVCKNCFEVLEDKYIEAGDLQFRKQIKREERLKILLGFFLGTFITGFLILLLFHFLSLSKELEVECGNQILAQWIREDEFDSMIKENCHYNEEIDSWLCLCNE